MAILRWGRRWDPLEELAKMQRHMDRIFGARDRGLSGDPRDFPLLNLYETTDDYVVTAEIPGVAADAVDITVVGDSMTVKCKREPEAGREKTSCHRQERDFGSFARTISLPGAIAGDKVDATYVNGVLQVKLPKAEEGKPRVINVSQ